MPKNENFLSKFFGAFMQGDAWLVRKRDSLSVNPKISKQQVQGGAEKAAAVAAGAFSVGWGLLSLFVLVGGMFVYFFVVGPATNLSDPNLKGAIPTAVPTPTSRAIVDPWKNEVWLSQDDARALRQKIGVVNLALLDRGGALYSAQHSVVFTGKNPWASAKPFGMTTLNVEGSAVEFTYGNKTYDLNAYQPFVFKESPDAMYVVDSKGKVWQADRANVQLVAVDSVKTPVGITPNPNLTFTLGR